MNKKENTTMPPIAPVSSLQSALGAVGPLAGLADKLKLFGQFAGAWETEIVYHSPEGDRRIQGEWHFGWVLEGRAIQDVWIAPKRALRNPGAAGAGEYGTVLRFYDPRSDAWRVTFVGLVNCVVMSFIARLVDSEIVMEGSFAPGVLTRWIFSHITHDRFDWRHVESSDEGQSWKLRQTVAAHRTEPPAVTQP
jgi:hypothetical protein